MKMLFDSVEDADNFIGEAEYASIEDASVLTDALIKRTENYISLYKQIEELEELSHISDNSVSIRAQIQQLVNKMKEGF